MGERQVSGAVGRVLCAAVLALAACGESSICDGKERSSSSRAPHLRSLKLVSQLTPEDFPLQGEGDPWTAVFAVEFTDEDGDLSEGEADFYLGSGEEPAVSLGLRDTFRQASVALDAEAGRLGLPLRFGPTGGSSEAQLAVVLTDGAGRRSECRSLELFFDVTRR